MISYLKVKIHDIDSEYYNSDKRRKHMAINVDHINPFLMASIKILKDVCQIDAKIGTPSAKKEEFTDNSIVIMLGVTGAMKGQVLINFNNTVACDIASKMTMMQITELDELGRSAVCELGNMILGHAATIFSSKGILIDITPPTMCTGNVTFNNAYSASICVPIIYEGDKEIEIYISVI